MTKTTAILAWISAASALVANSCPHASTWRAPGPNDVRSPCPMLNALANHGFLPRDGYNITQEMTETVFLNILNIHPALARKQFQFGLTSVDSPNATAFSLADIRNHNKTEHDGSMSRADLYPDGDNFSFNQTIFDQTLSHWHGPVVDVQMSANARHARVETSNKTNPDFTLTADDLHLSYQEAAIILLAFARDDRPGEGDKSWIKYFFGKTNFLKISIRLPSLTIRDLETEKLPYDLGWRRGRRGFGIAELDDMINQVIAADKNIKTTKK